MKGVESLSHLIPLMIIQSGHCWQQHARRPCPAATHWPAALPRVTPVNVRYGTQRTNSNCCYEVRN